MTNILLHGCSITLQVATLILVSIILANQGDDNGNVRRIAEIVEEEFDVDEIDMLVDMSHTPGKPQEFFFDPEQGAPCGNMGAGTRCSTGIVALGDSNHCNKCCFRLVAPGSCDDVACTCFSNDQGLNVKRRRGLD